MYRATFALVLVLASFSSSAQQDTEGPASEKAQKTYKHALEYVNKHMSGPALDEFKKADKQDDGHCVSCQQKMIRYGLQLRDWKTAELGATELVSEAHEAKDVALAHYQFGLLLMYEGLDKHKDDIFERAHEELTKALSAAPNFPDAIFVDGRVLGNLKNDNAAKAQFQKYVKMKPPEDPNRRRAERYIAEPELVRARMAPPFAVTTMDGQHISLDDLNGKVLLLDFWATWCGPCREALPHVQEMARKFKGQPLVILSVSVDEDEDKWREFVTKNEMTWPQYYDGGFTGPVATMFDVKAIPHTFTIDADGVLQDEHIGDAYIEGKLKKLLARAQQLQVSQTAGQ